MTPEDKKEKKRLYMIKYRKLNPNKGKEYMIEYRKQNPEQIKEWRKNNSDKIKGQSKKWKISNPEKVKIIKLKHEKNRKKRDPIFKLSCNIRSSIHNALKLNNFYKSNKTVDILGCSFKEFKEHIENKFESWMTWENYGLYNGTENYGWDIDHLMPISTAITVEDVIRLNHYTNLQPLCSYTNRVVKRNIVY